MTNLEAYQRAVADLGDVGSDQIVAHIAREFGIVIATPYIPIFRATLHFQKTGVCSPKSAESPCVLHADH